jgi:phosphatidylinositol alpha-1,6-mannosyltransferase
MRTFLLTDAFLPHAGGSRIYYYNLYRRLAENHGEQVTVLTRKSPGWREFDRQAPSGLRILRQGQRANHVKISQWPTLIPYFNRTLVTLGMQHGDVIHTGDLFPAGVSGGLVSSLTRIPYLTFCHGEEIPNTQRYRIQRRVRDWIYRNAAAMIANSRFTKNKLIEIGIESHKIHVITPAVDWERFKPEDQDPEIVRRYALADKIVLLTVGRLVPRKGHEAVLTALSQLRDRTPIRYIIAGTGPEEERLKTLAGQLGLGDAVIFTGYVEEDYLPKLFHACDVFIMTNQQQPDGDLEGFGMVFLEASAAGKPVIGGRSGGTADAVRDGDTGFLVDPLDIEELRFRMEQLLTNMDLRRRMGAAGRARACLEFDWSTRAATLHKLNLSIGGQASRLTCVEPS